MSLYSYECPRCGKSSTDKKEMTNHFVYQSQVECEPIVSNIEMSYMVQSNVLSKRVRYMQYDLPPIAVRLLHSHPLQRLKLLKMYMSSVYSSAFTPLFHKIRNVSDLFIELYGLAEYSDYNYDFIITKTINGQLDDVSVLYDHNFDVIYYVDDTNQWKRENTSVIMDRIIHEVQYAFYDKLEQLYIETNLNNMLLSDVYRLLAAFQLEPIVQRNPESFEPSKAKEYRAMFATIYNTMTNKEASSIRGQIESILKTHTSNIVDRVDELINDYAHNNPDFIQFLQSQLHNS